MFTTVSEPAEIFTRDLIQAVSDWQRGGSPRQKAARGLKLKAEAAALPDKFRQCSSKCFRQIALPKGSFWQLADTLELPETISAWTVSLDVARIFKNGVPSPGSQSIIFSVHSPPASVVLNLDCLLGEPAFVEAVETHKSDISGYYDGICRYGNQQREVVLEISGIQITDIHGLGGYSSNREELIEMMYGPNPSSENLRAFDRGLAASGQELGPVWINGEAKDRVIVKIRALMPGLRLIKKLQETKPLQ